MKAKFILTAAFLGMFIAALAQKSGNGGIARLNYNADKSGSLNSSIHFNSSFFINNYSSIPSNLKSSQEKIIAANSDYKSLQLTAMDDKKTVMVVLEISSNNKQEMTKAFIELFKELGVEVVDYNGNSVKMDEFSF